MKFNRLLVILIVSVSLLIVYAPCQVQAQNNRSSVLKRITNWIKEPANRKAATKTIKTTYKTYKLIRRIGSISNALSIYQNVSNGYLYLPTYMVNNICNSATSGNLDSICMIGMIFEYGCVRDDGYVIAPNRDNAISFYRYAAQRGHYESQLCLSSI